MRTKYRNRFAFGLLALAAGNGTPAAEEQSVIHSNLDELWRRANQALVLQGLKISTTDKDGGVIVGERADGAEPGWFECPQGHGRLLSQGYRVTVTFNQVGDGRYSVHVIAQGVNIWYRSHHVLFIRAAKHRTWIECTGTSGILEHQIMVRISPESLTG